MNFHVGHYVNLHIGAWNKPFKVISEKKAKPEAVKPIEFPTFSDSDVVIVPVNLEKRETTYNDLMESFISNLETA